MNRAVFHSLTANASTVNSVEHLYLFKVTQAVIQTRHSGLTLMNCKRANVLVQVNLHCLILGLYLLGSTMLNKVQSITPKYTEYSELIILELKNS
jgi:hypothetical protein